jgi:hypothetical protein
MAGDYSKFSFRRRRRVSAVGMQQGRVQLDADWNEQGQVLDKRIRNLAWDVWGRSWVSALSTPTAFKLTAIAGPDLAIGPGRLYAYGLAPEVFPDETFTWQKQPFLPIPQPMPTGPAIAYLDVFERELTWVEAPDILEKALHGVDTATRKQVAWQVKIAVQANPTCGMDLDALFPPSAGRLSTSATGAPASDDPCILSPTGGYRGLENRLYRVEIHVPGPLGKARFKWSRENASIVSPVEGIKTSGTKSELQVLRIGRDAVLRFAPNDWVEVTDDWRELMGQPGDMARIESIDETTRTLFLDRVVPSPTPAIPFGTTTAEHAARHTRVIRWDQSFEKHNNAVDADGLMTTGPGPIPLEDGVQASFSTDPVGGSMKVADHWSFEARTVDGTILELNNAPPDGVKHYYVPLALIAAGAGAGLVVTKDCRNLVPTTGTSPPPPPPDQKVCECCTLCVGEGGDVPDLKAALAMLPTIAPDPATAVRLCLLPGEHVLIGGANVSRPNTLIVGCWPRSRLRLVRGPLAFTANTTGLEEVIVLGDATPAAVVVSGASEVVVRRCLFDIERSGRPALLAEGASRFEVQDNEFRGAGIVIGGKCLDIRIEANDIGTFVQSAIAIDATDQAGEILIQGNRLVDGLGDGVEAIGVVEGLSILDNEIGMCRGEKTSFGGKTVGGIVLQTVEGLLVRDNDIAGNATDGPGDSAGIYVAAARGVEIARNHIVQNGRGLVDGHLLSSGIVIDDVRPARAGTDERGRFHPALIVEENIVRARRGQALFVVGQGDMRIQDNTFVSEFGVARGFGPPDLDLRDVASVVLIGGLSLPAVFEKLIEVAGSGEMAPLKIMDLLREGLELVPGRIMFQNNQVGMEEPDRSQGDNRALSAIAVFGFDDVDLSHNQVELRLDEVRYGVNALVVAATTRQAGNRFTEPPKPESCLASLLSLGRDLNGCSQNQGTHCILPFCFNQPVASSGNLVQVPTALCPPRDQ